MTSMDTLILLPECVPDTPGIAGPHKRPSDIHKGTAGVHCSEKGRQVAGRLGNTVGGRLTHIITIMYQATAARPLKVVLTAWSYSSRACIKPANGNNMIELDFTEHKTTACLLPEDSVRFRV